jgi:hypothetical protein
MRWMDRGPKELDEPKARPRLSAGPVLAVEQHGTSISADASFRVAGE